MSPARASLGAEFLRLFGQLVESRAREARPVANGHCLDGGHRERLHLGRSKEFGKVDERHLKAQVRLVGAVAVERLGPGHRGNRARAHAGRRLGGVEHGARDEAQHVILGDETRLDVQLGELELTIRTEILVA
jgi:hypothetical protein